ncbi:MAG TPA: phosphoserine phosphatase SerB [Roseiarcus sp.]|jgi:phosphoserine phosphatase
MKSAAYVVTLVVNPEDSALSDALIARAAQVLPNFAGSQWLSPGVAADLFYDGEIDARGVVTPLVAAERVDVIAQATANRAKRLLVADMDSTLIGQECIDELADFAGVGAYVADITERAMRGEITFEPALRKRVALLAGLPESVIDEVLATRITLTPGARTLARTMRARGAHVAIVSGGFQQFTGAIAERIGASEHRANRLLTADGKLLGKVGDPILGSDAKLSALKEISARLGLAPHETMAAGDGANDLAMLGAAGLGVAFHAKPKVAAQAHARIDHADLTALLYAQGIAADEFVRD